MPRLLLFVPCEKVIIAQDDNNATLISIINEITGKFEFDESVAPRPTEILLPWRWTIFTMWRREEGEEDKSFEQTVQFVSPSGKSAKPTAFQFTLDKKIQRINLQVANIPGSENGEWTLRLFLNEIGTEKRSEPVATYPLFLKFENVPSVANLPQ